MARIMIDKTQKLFCDENNLPEKGQQVLLEMKYFHNDYTMMVIKVKSQHNSGHWQELQQPIEMKYFIIIENNVIILVNDQNTIRDGQK